MTDVLEGWSEYNVAMTGAAAALAGLVIVAASVNIGEIVKSSSLTSRLGSGIGTLVLAIAVSALGLFPGIPTPVYGVCVLVGAALGGVLQTVSARDIVRDPAPESRMRVAKAALGFVPLVAYAAGGLLLVASTAEAGAVLVAVGSILAICSALLISWVALVEVLR